MTLLICPECNASVSEEAKVCPACGCPAKGTSVQVVEAVQRKRRRGKVTGLLMMVVAIVSFSCMAVNEDYRFAVWSVIVFLLGFIVFLLGRMRG